MQLSYLARVICLALCSAGLLHMLLEGTAWFVSGLLPPVAGGSARRVERSLFLLALAARLMPWLLSFGLLVPAYLRGEDNPAAERVGSASLALAACVLVWSLTGIVRALAAALKVHRCCRLCRVVGRSADDLPLLLYPGERSLLAVAGVFAAKVIVSQPLLDANRFSRAALAVALAHEAAHVRHRDNLKLLLLSLLPHVSFSTESLPSLQQRWRLAAELAADEEGTEGEPARSLLLAQMLVAMAREGSCGLPQGLVGLFSASEHLRVRVERLLAPPDSTSGPTLHSRRTSRTAIVSLAGCAAALTLLAMACLLFGHPAAEYLLHLG
jgi:hypothetical protein